MADRLKDKVAIVTGAGSIGPGWGNGKAAAVVFAREGAKIVAADLNVSAAEETRDIMRGEGGTCIAIEANVTSADDIKAVVATSSVESTFCITMSACQLSVVRKT